MIGGDAGPRSGRGIRAVVVLTVGIIGVAGCGTRPASPKVSTPESPPKLLSRYALFKGNPADQRPADGVIPYALNTPLFSDYAEKFRFVKLPAAAPARYRESDVFDFPVGTVIAKTFAYPADARDPSKGRRLIETRVLAREADGWVGLPYVWNDSQTDAKLEVAGGTLDVAWIQSDGKQRANNYIIPNMNQCKGCHKTGEQLMPIGPKARHLNGDFAYNHGVENQLAYWSRTGALAEAPSPEKAPRAPKWDDTTSGTLDARARAWLEINCAHCHNPDGPARNSGLNLLASNRDPVAFGIFKSPVAAGLGSGGRAFDIVPGKPDDSILAYRIASTHPGVMMPELGKRLVHDEGVALIREWIANMPEKPNSSGRSVPAK